MEEGEACARRASEFFYGLVIRTEKMQYVQVHLGAKTADAEEVAIRFENGDLCLTFTDWQEKLQAIAFTDAIAFRWQEIDEAVPRDDESFEVVDSPWLVRQAYAQNVRCDDYAHYVLCFNASGRALELIARRIPQVESR